MLFCEIGSEATLIMRRRNCDIWIADIPCLYLPSSFIILDISAAETQMPLRDMSWRITALPLLEPNNREPRKV
jgi:hypothetical protein